MVDFNKMLMQSKEFDAASKFAEQLRRHNQTAVVDDDYPQVRHEYEGALCAFIEAMANNGRFLPGNRYKLAVATSGGMRRYTMQDRSTGPVTRTDENLTLQDVYEMTDWLAEELDEIASFAIGASKLYGGTYVKRTN